MPEAQNLALPGATNDTWRTWLMTGAHRGPVDRRRLRGAHRGLKRMLLEGMGEWSHRPYTWKEFSDAMVRHAVDEAIRALPSVDKTVVKLAYFGGFSNREIASEVGITEATVQRRLRRALSRISDHVQHGAVMARRAVYALIVWLCGRWCDDWINHAAQAGVVVAAAVLIASGAASPAQSAAPRSSTAPVTSGSASHISVPNPAAPVVAPLNNPQSQVSVPGPASNQLPIALPVKVSLPPFPTVVPPPPPPVEVKLPAA